MVSEINCWVLDLTNFLSAVFQAGGLVVVLVEVVRKAYLASIVPVIVNTILNEHQIITDIVSFVAKGDFPRSRLNEKQRGKILASWVTRKLRTIAQFSIRDPDVEESSITAVPEDRVAGPGSLRLGSMMTASEPFAPGRQQQLAQRFSGAEDPNYAAEQNLPYESSIVESPPVPPEKDRMPYDADHTPVAGQAESFPLQAEYDGPHERGYFTQKLPAHDPEVTPQPYSRFDLDGSHDDRSTHTMQQQQQPRHVSGGSISRADDSSAQYLAYHPSRERGSSLSGPWDNGYYAQGSEHLAGVQEGIGHYHNGSTSGGLRVANPEEEEEWPREAVLHMRGQM